MITQKKMKEWIPEAIERFKSMMPATDVQYPEIVITSGATAVWKREEAVERVNSPQKNPGSATTAMECLHGEFGDVIMIYQKQFRENRYNPSEDKELFMHCLWHELGHFYAIHHENAKCPSANLVQYMDQQTRYGAESVTQIGYLLWNEFIAETIACRIDLEPRIDWNKTSWHSIREELKQLLEKAFYSEEYTIDEYSLGLYFAILFSDKRTAEYLQGAENGTILYYKEYLDPSRSKTFKQAGVEPLPLEVIEDDYYPVLNELQDYLRALLMREKYWEISKDSVTEIGEYIATMRDIKCMRLNRRMHRERIMRMM